jgi:hypothetical protein
MTWISRSMWRAAVVAALSLLVALPVQAQSPVPSDAPLSPEAGAASWAQVVHRPDGGTEVVVGQLGTAGLPVLSEPVEIRVDGPQDDWFLAWWRRDGWTTVVQLESRGTVRPLLRTRDVISAATLDPGVDHWSWAVAKGDGSLAEIRRAKTYPDRPTSGRIVGGGSDLPATRLLSVAGGRRLRVELRGPNGYRLRTANVRSGTRWQSEFEGRLRVIGDQGGELIAGTPADGDRIAAPLVAIDPATGAARSITTASGTGAYIAEDSSLVWDEMHDDGSVEVRVQEPGGVPRTVASVTAPGAVLASTSGDARAASPAVAALVPAGSWLSAGDPTAVVAVDLGSGSTHARPAFDVLGPTGSAWDPVPLGTTLPRGAMESVTTWQGGLVAVGRDERTGRRFAWRTTNGERWTRTALPAATADVPGGLILAGDGPRLLLVGFIDEPDHRVALWTSTDARRWTAVPAQPALRFARRHAMFVNLIDAGSQDGRWFVAAQRCVEGCRDPVLLASSGGRRWSRSEGPEGATWITGGVGRFIADGATQAGARLVFASPDGAEWEALGETPLAPYHHRLMDTSSGLVLIASAAYDDPLTIWRSDDGAGWELTHTDALPWEVEVTVADGDRLALLGRALLDAELSSMQSASLVSLDGGRTWSRSTGTRSPAGSSVSGASFDGVRILAVGSTREPRPAIWVTALPE